MSKLILQFEGVVLKEFGIGSAVTIGRLPDNTVIIENPAVSGHHARVIRDGDAVILEDLESTNGTFVNDKHVTRQTLKHGDVILVGKHRLFFDSEAAAEAPAIDAQPSALKNLGDTVYLDTKNHRALLATLRNQRAAGDPNARPKPAAAAAATPAATPAKTTAVPASASAIGVLRVLDGKADQTEYRLEAQTSLVGSSHGTTVRLQGWFKPRVAIAIARSGSSYVVTALGGTTMVNSKRLHDRHELKNGDILQVSGLTLEFRFEERPAAKQATA